MDDESGVATGVYDIERSMFATRILEMGIIALGERSYDEWKVIAPERVYAFDTHVRMERLRHHVASLNDIPKLLAFGGPLQSPAGNVGRLPWIEVCVDLALARLTSVRDITLFLVAETFELGLHPRDVTVGKLRKAGVPDSVMGAVEDLANAAIDLRAERNRRVHRGERRRFGSDDHMMLWTVSVAEANGITVGNISSLSYANRPGETYALSRRCGEISEALSREFQVVADEVVDATIRVLSSLEEHFESRWAEKLSRSQLGL